jgi:hypothetical protein
MPLLATTPKDVSDTVQKPLDGGSAHWKVSTYVEQHKQKEYEHNPCPSGIRTKDSSVRAVENSAYLHHTVTISCTFVSSNFITVTKSIGVRWTGCAARMDVMRSACNTLFAGSETT